MVFESFFELLSLFLWWGEKLFLQKLRLMPSFHTKICGWKLLRFVYVDAWVARVCMYKNVTKRWLLLSGFFFFFKLRYDRNDAIGVMNIWCCWTLYSHILDIFLSICLIPSIIQTSLSIYTGRKWNQVIRVY